MPSSVRALGAPSYLIPIVDIVISPILKIKKMWLLFLEGRIMKSEEAKKQQKGKQLLWGWRAQEHRDSLFSEL